MDRNLPIGVFDSGVGGLTVVKEIMNQLPQEQIIYFGDTARVPYGDKSRETVTAYSRQITHFLLSKGVKAVVIACNTASAYALETVQKESPVPMLGVIKPGAKTAAATTKSGRIGVIGTEGTIRSGLYEAYLREISPESQVFGKACPLFVPLVEEGWIEDEVTRQVSKRYLAELLVQKVDTVVLGCTHYPLLRQVIQDTVGDSVTLVNPAYETACELRRMLGERDCLNDGSETPAHTFYVSDGAEKFRKFANSILPCEMVEAGEVFLKVFSL